MAHAAYGVDAMDEVLQSTRRLSWWLLFAAGAILLGAGVCSGLTAYGVGDFACDRRGEWALPTAPICMGTGLLLSGFGTQRFVGSCGYTRRQIGLATVTAVCVSCACFTWRFSQGALLSPG